jgi:hypothetical protein
VEASSRIHVYATPQSREFKHRLENVTVRFHGRADKNTPPNRGRVSGGILLRLNGATEPPFYDRVASIGIGKHFRVILQCKTAPSEAEHFGKCPFCGDYLDRRDPNTTKAGCRRPAKDRAQSPVNVCSAARNRD